MKEDTVVAFRSPDDFQEDPLTEVLRTGARKLLAQAVEAEVETFLEIHRSLVDEAGRRRVVRNGYLPKRDARLRAMRSVTCASPSDACAVTDERPPHALGAQGVALARLRCGNMCGDAGLLCGPCGTISAALR